MTSSVRASDAQRKLAELLREDAAGAAGADGIVSRADQEQLTPYSRARADALRAAKPGLRLDVDALVDRGMRDAMSAWRRVNTGSARDRALLSQQEIKAVAKADPSLGSLTLLAARRVQQATPGTDPALIPTVSITSATPGFSLSASGDLFTVRAEASVPVGAKATLTIDGFAQELTRRPNGFGAYFLSVPAGYGFESVSDQTTAEGTTAVLRIRKDDPSWPTPAEALAQAREALVEYVKTERVNDDDWQNMIGYSWDEAVAHGVLADIAAFGTGPDDELKRNLDTLIFVGRGPLDLYTEATVRKKDGKVLNLLVEID